MSQDQKPAAVLYTHTLLAGSMTFIRNQGEALRNYVPVYAGARRIDGIALPAERSHALNEGGPLGYLREAAFRKWGSAPQLVRRLREHRPAIVHAHFGTCGPAGMALSQRLGVPLVVTFHGQDATLDPGIAASSHRGRELKRHKDEVIAHTGVFIAVSNFIRDKLLEQGYPPDKLVVHRNGIDVDYFRPDGDGARDPIIVFVGRFQEKKGARYLLEAAERLHADGVRFRLVMIGSGALEPEIRAAAERSGIDCELPGFLPPEQVRRWLGRARVVAVPSVTAANGDSEGLPTVLLEAQAMATPIVGTRHSGIPEGVREGVTAELVDERDSEALARELRTFLESADKARAFGAAARRFVVDEFSMQTQVAGLEAIYAELIARD